MELDLLALLSGNETLLTFLVIGFGYLLGKLKLGAIELGPTTGVLIAGLVGGYLGFDDDPDMATFGFTLFIFCVGLQAGPRFFSAFLEDGLRYIALALVVALGAFGIAFALAGLIGFEFGIGAGLLAGALTSTPTLVGAQDAIASGLASLPEGLDTELVSRNVSVGYAITYLFGTAGLIVFIRYFPQLLRIDLPAEAAALARERGLDDSSAARRSDGGIPVIRAYQATERVIGKSLQQLNIEAALRAYPLAVRRGGRLLDLEPDLRFEEGDVLSAIVAVDDLRAVRDSLGQEVLDPELLDHEIVSEEIVISRAEATGKVLQELRLPIEHGCFPSGLIRARVVMPLHDGLVLARGDRLQVTGEKQCVRALADRLGHIETAVEETDLLTVAFGIVGGLLLGTVLVKLGDLSIGLGSAGGLLLLGILIGFLRSLHPTFGGVPAPARFILMQLGLMLFMASVGLKAGDGIIAALASVGPALILCGIVVTLAPVLIAYAFGRLVLDMNPALLLGAVTGAMTSTPSLSVISEAAKSPLPALGYAGTYTFANVFLTFAGTLMVTL